MEAEPAARQQQIERCIGSGQFDAALRAALGPPPHGAAGYADNPAAKDLALKGLSTAILGTKDGSVDEVLEALSPAEHDTLMKLLYAALAQVTDAQTSSALFKWHEKLTQKAGMGSIMRALTDQTFV